MSHQNPAESGGLQGAILRETRRENAASKSYANAEHPGPELKALIRKSGFRYGHVAEQIGVLPSVLSEVLNAKRPLSAKMCVSLEAAFGLCAEEWHTKQAVYDVRRERKWATVALKAGL